MWWKSKFAASVTILSRQVRPVRRAFQSSIKIRRCLRISLSRKISSSVARSRRASVLSAKGRRIALLQVLRKLQLDIPISAKLGALSAPLRQQVAIAKAVRDEAAVLLLDEPTAALNTVQAEFLFNLVRPTRQRWHGRSLYLASPSGNPKSCRPRHRTSRRKERWFGCGLIMSLPIKRHNITIASVKTSAGKILVNHAKERRTAGQHIHRFRIAPADTEYEVGLLSGGNQRKVLLARARRNRRATVRPRRPNPRRRRQCAKSNSCPTARSRRKWLQHRTFFNKISRNL